MFFVINKEKIYAYVVSIVTVIMLFCMANLIVKNTDTIQTSTNTINEIPANNVKLEENNVILTNNEL